MNAKKFSDAMSELDTKYIEEAMNNHVLVELNTVDEILELDSKVREETQLMISK